MSVLPPTQGAKDYPFPYAVLYRNSANQTHFEFFADLTAAQRLAAIHVSSGCLNSVFIVKVVELVSREP